MVEVPMVGGRAPKLCPRTTLADILQPRAEELLGLIHEDIQRLGLDKEIRSGVVLTGGGSELEGVVEIAEGIFDGPVRRGRALRASAAWSTSSRGRSGRRRRAFCLYGHRYKPAAAAGPRRSFTRPTRCPGSSGISSDGDENAAATEGRTR